MVLKEIYTLPSENSINKYYFTVLGRCIAFASEFEYECIELSKIYSNYNILKNTVNDGYLLEYDKNHKIFNKKTEKYIPLNKYINDLKNNDILDNDLNELFILAKDMRNKIAHYYGQQFYRNQNDINKLEELINELKVDISNIIDAKSMIDLIFMLTVDSESNLPLMEDGSTNIKDYRVAINEWIFKQ